MAISKNIIDLTALALKDRVLTFVERKVIIDAAMKEGVSSEEINSYLDNALNERLRSYSKEDLKRCPHCGAQIPLISDECPYCGQNLEHPGNNPTPPPYIEGVAADIIHSENIRVATERKNIRTCPDCGAPFPLVSNICENCGHVLHEQKDSELNVKTLISNIQQCIDDLKSTPQPSFWQVLWYRRGYWLILMALVFLLVAVVFCVRDVYEWKYLLPLFGFSLFFLIASVVSLNKSDIDSPVQKFEDRYDSSMLSKEMYENHIKVLYGKNPEATKVLGELSDLAASAKKKRGSLQLSILVCLFFTIIAVVAGFSFTLSESVATVAKIKENIKEEKAMNYISLWDIQSPLTLLRNEASLYVSVDSSCNPVLSYDVISDKDKIKYDSMDDSDIIEYKKRVSGVKLEVKAPLPEDKVIALWLHGSDGGQLSGEISMPLLMLGDYSEYHATFSEMLRNGCGDYYAEFLSKNPMRISMGRLLSNIAHLREDADRIDSYSIYLINIKDLQI